MNATVFAGIGGLGTTELLVLAGILVLLFGARKLPELGRGIGEGIKSFKDAMKSGGETPSPPPPNDKRPDAP